MAAAFRWLWESACCFKSSVAWILFWLSNSWPSRRTSALLACTTKHVLTRIRTSDPGIFLLPFLLEGKLWVVHEILWCYQITSGITTGFPVSLPVRLWHFTSPEVVLTGQLGCGITISLFPGYMYIRNETNAAKRLSWNQRRRLQTKSM